jgi:hypothetical protein
MAQTLQLEYACTKAETDQAQSLAMRKQLGGGSKWRTWLVLFLMLSAETRWSFILWKKGTQIWTMFPKRAFQSTDAVSRARGLLARNLQQSRWFLG